MALQEWQIEDTDIITNDELGAGDQDTSVAASELPYSISSVDSSTKTITVSSGNFNNVRPEKGDAVVITNSDAAGTYTLDTQVSETEITVQESIPDASSGDLQIYHPPGATRVGVNQNNFSNLSGSTLQQVLESADSQVANSIDSPTAVGQVLYTVDGSSWAPEDPMISRQGWLVNDNGLLLVK